MNCSSFIIEMYLSALNNVYTHQWMHDLITELLKCFESEVKGKVTQSCPTLCDPVDYTEHGIL